MNARRPSFRLLLLSSVLASSAAFAVHFPKGVEAPQGRDETARVMFELRDLMDMVDDGAEKTAPASLDEAVPAPGEASDVPMAPGDMVDTSRLARFLSNSLDQCRGQTWQNAYGIMKNALQTARDSGPLPDAMRILIEGALEGAREAQGYEDSYKTLKEAAREIAGNPGGYTGYDFQAFRNLLAYASGAGANKSWRNSYFVRKHQLLALNAHGHFIQENVYRTAVHALLEAGQKGEGWENKAKILKNGTSALAQGGPDTSQKTYMEMIAGVGSNVSYQYAYLARKELYRPLADNPGLLYGRVLPTLARAAFKAGAEAEGWENKNLILKRTANEMLQIGPDQDWRRFFAVVHNAGSDLSWKNSYFTRKIFAQTLLEMGDGLDRFDRVSIETAVESARRATGWDQKSKILKSAFGSLR